MQSKTKSTTGFLPFATTLLLFALQNTESVAATETLAEVPEHVLRGLPEEVRLLPSAVDKTRIGEYSCGVGQQGVGCSQGSRDHAR